MVVMILCRCDGGGCVRHTSTIASNYFPWHYLPIAIRHIHQHRNCFIVISKVFIIIWCERRWAIFFYSIRIRTAVSSCCQCVSSSRRPGSRADSQLPATNQRWCEYLHSTICFGRPNGSFWPRTWTMPMKTPSRHTTMTLDGCGVVERSVYIIFICIHYWIIAPFSFIYFRIDL